MVRGRLSEFSTLAADVGLDGVELSSSSSDRLRFSRRWGGSSGPVCGIVEKCLELLKK
jgi:hypothetical protein